jgi:hypothetical protein
MYKHLIFGRGQRVCDALLKTTFLLVEDYIFAW